MGDYLVKIYVNRPQLEKNRHGENGPCWAVDVISPSNSYNMTFQAYEVYTTGPCWGTPPAFGSSDGVALALYTASPVNLKISADDTTLTQVGPS